MTEARADAESTGGVEEELAGLKEGEDPGEDDDLAAPVASCPKLAEAGIQRFVELELQVLVVGGEGAANADERGGRGGSRKGNGSRGG